MGSSFRKRAQGCLQISDGVGLVGGGTDGKLGGLAPLLAELRKGIVQDLRLADKLPPVYDALVNLVVEGAPRWYMGAYGEDQWRGVG